MRKIRCSGLLLRQSSFQRTFLPLALRTIPFLHRFEVCTDLSLSSSSHCPLAGRRQHEAYHILDQPDDR